jgi:hypothetical protein
MIAILLMIYGAVFGFLYGLASFVLPFVPDMDVLTSTGTGFALGGGVSLVVIALRLLTALAQFAIAIVLLIAPLASWMVTLLTDPLGRKARRRQAAWERAHIDAIYPPPDHPERRRYVET